MNSRRTFLKAATAFPLAAWTADAGAQAKPPVVVGWLSAAARDANLFSLTAFNEGMASFGWKPGSQYVVEERWADGRVERLQTLARELAEKKPAVIVVVTNGAALAASLAAPTTPVVLAGGDPTQTGLVKSFARPGGMITGLSNINSELVGKKFELLKESVPKLRRVGYLADATLGGHADTVRLAQEAARHLRLELVTSDLSKPEDIAPAIARLAKEKIQALVVGVSAFFSANRQQILKLALEQRWPTVGNQGVFADAGALLSYGADRLALYRRSAYYVDRILKGTKPAELPIEMPTKFEMVLNMKTAKALGLKFPNTILVQATRVIE